jgi:hypothetical protein
MSIKTITAFLLAVAVCGVAATHRFHDSAHAMGTLKRGGGQARHPALLDRDRDSWVLIATAGVVPPFRGNARVALEGNQGLGATFHNAGPAVNLGLHHRPEFRADTYYDLRPGDRIALWVKLSRNIQHDECVSEQAGTRRPEAALAFYDTATDARLLTIPIRFIGKEGGNGHGH